MKRKVKKWPVVVLLVIIIGIISTVLITKHIHKINSYEYKLGKLGYDEKQTTILIKNLKKKQLDDILTKKYNKLIPTLINQKYFIYKNLDKYIKYDESLEKDKSIEDIIAIINVRSNNEWYSNPTETNVELNEKMLVNKFNNLTKEYAPNDLIELTTTYAYGTDQFLRQEAYNEYISMFNAAKEENITLIVNSSYRDYDEQEQIYKDYSDWYGEEDADKIAARPGFSEHQTGYTVDIQTFNTNRKNFEESDAYKWLDKNAYKYGFILRYPKDKEYLTGYDYESWHFRYVGKKIAKYIQENNITFDEYYAYFIDKN